MLFIVCCGRKDTPPHKVFLTLKQHKSIWAATWQNQRCESVPSEDSDQLGHPPSLIRVFAVHSMDCYGPKLSSCWQQRLWSDWANAQADLSLHWAHTNFVGFVMSRLKSFTDLVPLLSAGLIIEPPHDKTNNVAVWPANTPISLGIRPVWSESLLCTQWVAKEPSFLPADSEDSEQTGQMPRLIWVFAGRTCHFVGFVMRWLNWSKCS